MSQYNYAYIYDELNGFDDRKYTARELAYKENQGDGRIREYRKNLYSDTVRDDAYRLVLINTDKPYFRRYAIGDNEHKGFSSVCESFFHRAFKKAIRNSKTILLSVNSIRKPYVLKKEMANDEERKIVMGKEYEVDCEYQFNNNQGLKDLIKSDRIIFELHDTCEVTAGKSRDFRVSGYFMVEIDLDNYKRFFPPWLINGSIALDKAIDMIRIFIEKENHYLRPSAIWTPEDELLEWANKLPDCCRSRYYDNENKCIYQIVIFRDKFSSKTKYNFYINTEDGQSMFVRDYYGREMSTITMAQKCANHKLSLMLKGLFD